MRLATGEASPEPDAESDKNPAAVALGRMGGRARADSLSKKRMTAIAKQAAASRWGIKSKRKK
jgi:hypothetical protein